jgi:hypothetical protein
MPSGLGAEPKKVALLIVLLALAPVAYWYGNSGAPPGPAAPAPRTNVAAEVPRAPAPRPTQRAATRVARTEEFRPSLKLPEDFDLSQVDPTLHLELLARVRQTGEVGGARSLFEFYTPPPPPPPKIEPIRPAPPPEISEAKPAPPVKPAPPPPPPIPLRYFGYEGTPRAGAKLRALFVDGEEHFVAGENELIRNRYRVVRIGTTSADVEDTVARNTQTLRIVERVDQ